MYGIIKSKAKTSRISKADVQVETVSGGTVQNTIDANVRDYTIHGRSIAFNQLLDLTPEERSITINTQIGHHRKQTNHKYLYTMDIKADNENYFTFASTDDIVEVITIRNIYPDTSYKRVVFFSEKATNNNDTFLYFLEVSSKIYYKNVQVFDLTLMGLENITAEQFEQMFPDYYPYNAGSIESVGKWGLVDLGTLNWGKGRYGYYSNDFTLAKADTKNILCAKYQTSSYVWEDGKLGIASDVIWVADLSYATAEAFKEAMSGVYLLYEPNGEPTQKGFAITTKNGDTEKTTIIPLSDELRRIGNTKVGDVAHFDKQKITRKCGIVDLGTLNWYKADGQGYYATNFTTAKAGTKNLICPKYPTGLADTWEAGKIGISNANAIWVADTSYSDAQAFKSAMSGVMLVYELAEPTEEAVELPRIRTLDGQTTITIDAHPTINLDPEAEFSIIKRKGV